MRDESFYAAVYRVVREVPIGQVATYGDIATILGHPRNARQVGWALAALRAAPDHTDVPWHRIINAQGRISHRGDTWRAEAQAMRLVAEGVELDDAGRIALAKHRWAPLNRRH